MTSRREFVRRGALWAMAAAIIDPAEVLDRLSWRRTSFPSGVPALYVLGPRQLNTFKSSWHPEPFMRYLTPARPEEWVDCEDFRPQLRMHVLHAKPSDELAVVTGWHFRGTWQYLTSLR